MRISRKKKKKVISSIIVIAIILVAGTIATAFYIRQHSTDNDGVNYDEPTKEQTDEGEKTAEQTEPEPSDENPTPGETDQKRTVDVTITSANQTGEMLQVRATIQALNLNGKCTLILSRSGYTPIQHEADTQPVSSYSTCRGFNIDTSQIPSGEWSMTLTYDSETTTGKANQNINLN